MIQGPEGDISVQKEEREKEEKTRENEQICIKVKQQIELQIVEQSGLISFVTAWPLLQSQTNM